MSDSPSLSRARERPAERARPKPFPGGPAAGEHSPPRAAEGADSLPAGRLPRHVAIVMDGNGRWARRRFLPRVEGHRAGVSAARECIRACAEAGVECLTLFAFSSENWARPVEEVEQLIGLFGRVLEREFAEPASSRVNVRFIGDRSAFPRTLRDTMDAVERRTAANRGLVLVIAANYGGHWDIVNAARRVAQAVERGEMTAGEVDRAALEDGLALRGLPSPDLLVRTGGEQRISNFLLWNLAYTELYFTNVLWPEFDRGALSEALRAFGERERRFGRTSEQVGAGSPDLAGAR